jgi:hypothetical protein
VDATLEEEACSDCTITYFVFPNGNIALIKSGNGSVRREIFQNITAVFPSYPIPELCFIVTYILGCQRCCQIYCGKYGENIRQ